MSNARGDQNDAQTCDDRSETQPMVTLSSLSVWSAAQYPYVAKDDVLGVPNWLTRQAEIAASCTPINIAVQRQTIIYHLVLGIMWEKPL
jgi:uncharacterized membrane protein